MNIELQDNQQFLGRRRPMALEMTDAEQLLLNRYASIAVFRDWGAEGDGPEQLHTIFSNPIIGSHLLRSIRDGNFHDLTEVFGDLAANPPFTMDQRIELQGIRDFKEWIVALIRLGWQPLRTIPQLEAVANRLSELGVSRVQGVANNRILFDQGAANYRMIPRNGYNDIVPPGGFGGIPIDSRIPGSTAIGLARDMYKDIPRTQSALKPDEQFQDLLGRVGREVDTGLFKYKEDILNYKSNHVYTALNNLKKRLNETKIRIGGDTVVFTAASPTYFPLAGLNPLFPVVIKLRVVGQPKPLASSSSGVYLTNARAPADVNNVMKLVNFGIARRKEYNFALAPYFGYVDSMYSVLKNPIEVAANVPGLASLRFDNAHTAFTGGLQVGTHHRLTINVGKRNDDGIGGGAGNDYANPVINSIQDLERKVVSFRDIVTEVIFDFSVPNPAAMVIDVDGQNPEPEFQITLPIRMTRVFEGVIGYYLDPARDNRIFAILPGVDYPFLNDPMYTHPIARLRVPASLRPVLQPVTRVAFLAYKQGMDAARVQSLEAHKRWYYANVCDISLALGPYIRVEYDRLWIEVERLRVSFNALSIRRQLQWALDPVQDEIKTRLFQGILASSDLNSALPAVRAGFRELINEVLAPFREVLDPVAYWENNIVDFDRPLRVPNNANQNQIETVDSKEQLMTYLSNRLDQQVNSIMGEYARNAGAQIGPRRRLAGAVDPLNFTWGGSAIHLPIAGNDEQLRVKVWLEGFDSMANYLKYIQLMSWIRNFTYSRQQEKQKISRARISKFVNSDSRTLRKVVATFGGVPDGSIARR